MLSTKEVMAKYVGLGENKVKNSIGKTILLAVIAGFFIALAGVGANTAIATIKNPSIAKLVSAAVFPAGLSMVSCAGCELFTGDSLIVISLLDKRIKFVNMIKCWLCVYLGNLIGSVFVAANPVYLQMAVERGIEVSNLTISAFLFKNLFPVTIGNLIGGMLVGAMYWYIYLREDKK